MSMCVSNTTCENPRYIFASVPVSGRPVYWRDNKGRLVERFEGNYSRVPVVTRCGRCEGCRTAKQREWQSRITREMLQARDRDEISLFVTLTFDPSMCDVLGADPSDCSSNDGKRVYRDFVNPFFHRLRAKRGGGLIFRYFTVCEFGSDEGRLHFHFIITIKNWQRIYDSDCWLYRDIDKHYVHDNKLKRDRLQTDLECAFQHLFTRYWSVLALHNYPEPEVYVEYSRKYQRLIKKLRWLNTVPLGFVEKVTECDCGSAQYVTKYVNKVTEDIVNHKEPFHRQSQGLGLLDVVDCIQTLNIPRAKYYLVDGKLQTVNGYFFMIPKYYRKKLRMISFTYLESNRRFVQHSVGIARDSLSVGIGIPFLDGNHRVFSVDDVETFDRRFVWEYGSNTPIVVDSNDERSLDRFLSVQLWNASAYRLWGGVPLEKCDIFGNNVISLKNPFVY